MGQTIRVIVLNTDENVAADLRAVLLSVEGVKIVAEIDEPALLPQVVGQFPAEVLLVHLDPNPTAMMDVVAPQIEAFKGRLAAIAMTEDRDAELVMRAMRAGMSEFLWKPFPPEQLGEVLVRVGGERKTTSPRLGRVISVIGTVGGVGATQLATNLAVELSQLEHWEGMATPGVRPKVAVVDMDFRFGQVAMQLDAQPTYTLAELCDTPEQIDAAMIGRAMVQHSSGVHVLARPNDLTQADRIGAGQAAGVLAAIQEHYDFVVIDLPARFDTSMKPVFDLSDVYLLVMQLLVPAVRNADRILQMMSSNGYAIDRLRLVCSRFGRESAYLAPADVEATLRRSLDFILPDEWKLSATAVNMGAPLLLHGAKSKLRQAYQRIAMALAGTQEQVNAAVAEQNEAKRGLFSFFGASK